MKKDMILLTSNIPNINQFKIHFIDILDISFIIYKNVTMDNC